jgi:hypothetical protein
VSGASPAGPSAASVVVGVEVTDIAGSLRRHYPVRFGRSADPRCRNALRPLSPPCGVSSRRFWAPPC